MLVGFPSCLQCTGTVVQPHMHNGLVGVEALYDNVLTSNGGNNIKFLVYSLLNLGQETSDKISNMNTASLIGASWTTCMEELGWTSRKLQKNLSQDDQHPRYGIQI